MSKKIPFLTVPLQKFLPCKEINKKINDNKCNLLFYSRITKDTVIEDYDYIVIIGKNELKRIAQNDKCLYEEYKNKLFFVGNYCNSYNNYNDYKNVLYEIKSALNINFTKTYKNKFVLTNLVQHISITYLNYKDKNPESESRTSNENMLKYIKKYMTSSIKFIRVDEFETNEFLLTNYNNKIEIVIHKSYESYHIFNQSKSQKIKNIKFPLRLRLFFERPMCPCPHIIKKMKL
jgi:hypothetical protein